MERLSRASREIKAHYTVVVVGSGYGGAIAASRLARARQSVCVLERGREIVPGEFPDTLLTAASEFQVSSPAGRHGSPSALFELCVGEGISVLQGCGLGGTSLINANVSIRPDPVVFDQDAWPKGIRDDVDTRLARGFARASEMLMPAPYPAEGPRLKKLETMERAATRLGQRHRRLDLNVTFDDKSAGNHVGVSQPACTQCGDCVSGCNYGSKNTTAMNYLPDACNHGAEIFCEVPVTRVAKDGDRWRVYYRATGSGRDAFDAPDQFVTADVVVLGAGSLGSTKILMQSAQAGLPVSGRLGTAFSGNGDVLGFSYNNEEPVNAVGMGRHDPADCEPVGPCITSAIDLRDAPLEDAMIVEEGVIPGALGPILAKTFAATSGLGQVQRGVAALRALPTDQRRVAESLLFGVRRGAVHHSQTYLVMTHDGAEGELSLDRDRVQIRWPEVSGRPIFRKIEKRLEEIADANRGRYVPNPTWNLLPERSLVTVHPLGGCPMGDDATTGAVDHKGRVFSGPAGTDVHEGLYVADGAVLPTSVGVNPLLTISAVAERTCELLAEDRGWSVDYTLPSKPSATTPQESTVGIEFTESMKGFFSTAEKSDYQAGFDRGKAEQSPFEFVLTITSPDLPALETDSGHDATMTGTVTAPALSEHPLVVTNGRFNLFVENPAQIGTKNMTYRMVLRSESGDEFYVQGHKVVRDDPGLDVWPDTTTLYITVHRGRSGDGAVFGRGILHIEPEDLVRQLGTMRALNAPNRAVALASVARFNRLFARDLAKTYGGVFAPNGVLEPDAPPRKRRPLRAPDPTLHVFETADGVQLQLTRYQGGDRGPVILAPGFGNTAAVYALDTTETSFTEYLVAQEYDVFLFDRRSSPALPSAVTEYTIDDEVRYDWPAAVREVLRISGATDAQVVAHCMGSMTLLLAIMEGMAGVRNAVCSQVTTYFHTNFQNQLRAGMKIASILGALHVDTVTSHTKPNLADAALEALLRAVPIRRAERCNDPVCHRIFGIYGPVYTHAQLNNATHRAMDEIFGTVGVKVLEHLLRILGKGHAVDEGGADVYRDKIASLALPLHFIAGSENQICAPSSSKKLYDELVALHGPAGYSRTVFPKYAHLDCFVGTHAARDVFGDVVEHLDAYA